MLNNSGWYRKQLVSSTIIFFLMFVNHLFSGPVLKTVLNIVIWLTYAGILFVPRAWWTKRRLIIAASLILIETAAGLVWYHETNQIYFLAILVLSVTVHLSLSRSPIPVMAVMFVTAILYSQFGHESLFRMISFIVLSIVLYFNIRNRMQRNEMFELNKQRLAELHEAYEHLQEASVTGIKYAVLEERTRIARDIHDAVGHSLTSLIVQMQALRYMIKKDPAQADQSLEEMLVLARQGLQEIRTSVHSLADDHSLSGVTPLKTLLSQMEAQASIPYHFHSEINDEEVNMEIYGILFRVLQEAITNVIRHSQATLVEVSLMRENENLFLKISDNGIMDSLEKMKEGFGLRVMKERVEERGGRLSYSIQKPHGFEIIAEIPIAPRAQ